MEKLTWKSETRKIADLRPYEHNPRKMTAEAFEKLCQSIEQDGYHARLIVDTNGVVIGGHQRLRAMKKMGWKEVEVLTPSRPLTEEEFDRINVRDNLPFGDFDFDILANRFDPETLIEWGMPEEWLPKQEGVVNEPEGDEDEAPEAPATPQTVRGDIYEIGPHRLMCGDSTMIDDVEKLMGGVKADMVFTDPPYGYSFESNHYKDKNPHGMLKNDDIILDFIPCALSATKDNCGFYICASHQTAHKWRVIIDETLTHKNMIVWKKNNWSMGDLKGAYAGQHELIFFAHKGRIELKGGRERDVWEFGRDAPDNHPTQKPVELIEFAVKNTTDTHAIVLDLFGGSGTTIVAAHKLGRIGYLMELDERYCDVIVQRMHRLFPDLPIKRNGISFTVNGTVTNA